VTTAETKHPTIFATLAIGAKREATSEAQPQGETDETIGTFDMRHLMAMTALVVTMGLGSFQPVWAATKANGPPKLNVKPSCEAAAGTALARAPGSNVRTVKSCMRDENEARHQLAKQWAQFSPGEHHVCTSATRTGGSPSYVDLLTCLQMYREAKSEGWTRRCRVNTPLGVRDC
jgi:hypothetical protein